MSRKGFTIIEILLMVTIFVLISTAAIADFGTARGAARLRAATQELAANIQKAQAMAYANSAIPICTDTLVCGSGSSCDPTMAGCTSTPILSYGVALDINNDGKKYAVFADTDGSGTYRAGEAVPNGVISLPAGITIQSVTPLANKTTVYSYNAANSAPFVTCSTNCMTTVVFYDTQTLETRTVAVSKQTGAISVK